jgi:hypothetical protein
MHRHRSKRKNDAGRKVVELNIVDRASDLPPIAGRMCRCKMRRYSVPVRGLRLVATWSCNQLSATSANVRTAREAARSATGSAPLSTAPRSFLASLRASSGGEPAMLADSGAPRPAVLPILHGICLFSGPVSGDAEPR